MLTEKTAKTVNNAVKRYFRIHGISSRDAASRLGYSCRNIVDNHLSYGKFGKRMAAKWAEEFGFNVDFLLTGKGCLVKHESAYGRLVQENESLKAIIRIQSSIIGNRL